MTNAARIQWNGGNSTANGSVSLAEYTQTQSEVAEYSDAQLREATRRFFETKQAAQRAAAQRGKGSNS